MVQYLQCHSNNCDACCFVWSSDNKTSKITCAPSEDSDQPGHLPGLMRVLAVSMKKPWVLRMESTERTAKNMIRLGGCPG